TRGANPTPALRADPPLSGEGYDQQTSARRSGRSGEGLSLLHDVGDEDDGLCGAGLAARMGRFRRYLEGVALLDGAGRLALHGKLEAGFQDIGGFDARMGVPPDRHARLDGRFDKY